MLATASAPVAAALQPLPPEDEDRAGFYGLIAHLLSAPPAAALLADIAAAAPLEADPGIPEAADLAQAWDALRQLCRGLDAAAVEDEWRALFTGVGRPEVTLYASWYLTGFLMEKPLALLRDDLAELGLARRAGCGEPEDHLAAVCDAMRALVVDVRRPEGARVAAQQSFFRRHLQPWAARCCAAMEDAPGARFYRALGHFAAAFFALEGRALEIEA